jgi:hypothetical protein
MWIASCKVCASFPIISDQNAKTAKGYTEPFKLETSKKQDKPLQNKKCKQANSASFTDFCGLLELMENMMFGYKRNTNVNKGCKDFISQITKVKRSEVICKLENLNVCV